MEATANLITEKQMEYCAIATMHRMIEKFSDKHCVPFNSVFLQFTRSYVCEALFDYSTGIWMEGPDYLMDLYEESLENT